MLLEIGTSSSREPWRSLTGQSIDCLFVNTKFSFPSSINFFVITKGSSEYSEWRESFPVVLIYCLLSSERLLKAYWVVKSGAAAMPIIPATF